MYHNPKPKSQVIFSLNTKIVEEFVIKSKKDQPKYHQKSSSEDYKIHSLVHKQLTVKDNDKNSHKVEDLARTNRIQSHVADNATNKNVKARRIKQNYATRHLNYPRNFPKVDGKYFTVSSDQRHTTTSATLKGNNQNRRHALKDLLKNDQATSGGQKINATVRSLSKGKSDLDRDQGHVTPI